MERDESGIFTLPISSSPEIHDNSLEAWFDNITEYDRALVVNLFHMAIEAALAIGEIEVAKHWQGIVSRLPDCLISEENEIQISSNESLQFSHRHLSHLISIYPFSLLSPKDTQDSELIKRSLDKLWKIGFENWVGWSFAWLACLEARAGRGEKAKKAIQIFSEAFCLDNGLHCNGDQTGKYSKYNYRPITLEGDFGIAAAIQEMLLQSYNGVIKIFPAIPRIWESVSFKSLLAEGGFQVSARMSNGRVQEVEIISSAKNECVFEKSFRF